MRAAAIVRRLGGGGIAALVVAACFSERATSAATIDGRCDVPIGTNVAGSTLVVVRNFAFAPGEIRVKRGERVTWVNCETSSESHTSTSDGGAWDSPVLAPATAFTRTFDTVGRFTYHCEPHPFMQATVVVE